MSLDTVAFDLQVGCVLFQEQPDEIASHIGYWFRSLTSTERYMIQRNENVAIFRFLLLLRPYLEGTRSTIQNNQDTLRRILYLSYASGKVCAMALMVIRFRF